MATSIFNPVSTTIFTLIAIPLMIAAAYWLFVVNGPTPVVKARIEDFEEIEEQDSDIDYQQLMLQILKFLVPVVQQESWNIDAILFIEMNLCFKAITSGIRNNRSLFSILKSRCHLTIFFSFSIQVENANKFFFNSR